METVDPRTALAALIAGRSESYASLSRLIGRNAAYLQQFVVRGSPRRLAERDRGILAAYLGVSEAILGGTAEAPPRTFLQVPRIDARASAGPGGLVEEDRIAGGEAVDPAVIRRLGALPANISIVAAQGDSMLPTIADGDELWVDRGNQKLTGKGGIFVLRMESALVVKRLECSGRSIRVISDNPQFATIECNSVDLVGRVVRLTRTL